MVRIITFFDLGDGTLYEASMIGGAWNVIKIDVHSRLTNTEECPYELLAEGISREEAIEKLMSIASRLEEICEGCDTHISKCGPHLWAQQKKCCPDCSHQAPKRPLES